MQDSTEIVDNRQTGNWPSLIAQLQKRETATRELQRLTKRLDTNASEYGKSFQQALKKVPVGYEELAPTEPSMSVTWDEFLTSTDTIGSLISTMAHDVDENVCSVLATLADSMEGARRKLAPMTEAAQKQTLDNAATVEKMRQKYCKACRDHDSVACLLQDAGDSDPAAQKKKIKGAELEKKLVKAKTDMADATEAYRNAVTTANSRQDACNDRVRQFSAELFQTLRNREEITRESLAAYVKSVRTAAKAINEAMDKLEAAVQSFDADKDMAEFEQKYSIPLPKKFEFEAYVPAEDSEKQRSLSASGAELASRSFPKAQFGVPLAVMVERDGTPVPQVIKFLVEQMISLGGPHTQGVFRLVGEKEQIKAFRTTADSSGSLTTLKDPINASVLIKNWLRALPEPPIPTDLYEKVIDCQGEAVKVFEEIPEPNKTLVGFIIRFLQFMNNEQFVNYTMMNAPNLASMLAPCLISCPYEDLSKQLICTEKEKNFVLELISTLDTSRFPSFDTTEDRPIPPLKDSLQRPPAYGGVLSPPTSPVSPRNIEPPPDEPVLGAPPAPPSSQPPSKPVPSPPAVETPPPPVVSQTPAPPRPAFVPRAVPSLSRPSVLSGNNLGGGILRGVLVPVGMVRTQQPGAPAPAPPSQPHP